MSTVVNFGGKRIVEPGAYALTKSGLPQPEPIISAGITLLIDTGSGAGWGGGAGIAGQATQGKRSVYSFQDAESFRDFVRGGLHYDLAPWLFRPVPTASDVAGVPQLLYVRAAQTTAAVITVAAGASGTLKFRTKHEGLGANGVVTNGRLTRGFSARLSRGVLDPAKFQVSFYVGSYSGADSTGLPYDGVQEADTKPQLVATSPEVTSTAQLATWARKDRAFQSAFSLDPSSTISDTAVASSEFASLAGEKLAVGGTESFGAEFLDQVLDSVVDCPHTFFLSDQAGTDPTTGAGGLANLKILAHIQTAAPFPKFLVVGGGNSQAEFAQAGGSLDIARAYDTHSVMVVHSGVEVADSGGLLVERSSLYHAAIVLGRMAGLPSYEPVTYKNLGIRGLLHELSAKERPLALQGGVCHTKFVDGIGFVPNQGINTLQLNTRLFNDNGHSHDMQPERIDSELINTLQTSARTSQIGRSRATVSEAEVKAFTESKLQQAKRDLLIADRTGDENPGPAFQNVTARLVDDYWMINFGYRINGPINKLFFIATKI